jgi:legumain
LQSTSEDNVFINFADHGGTNLIAFPSGSLSSSSLNSAFKKMHDKKMYKKLVFYLEACESGSMFENKLPTNLNIYATTAANAQESSWGTYCPPDDKVNGKSIKSCLGDLYSVNWMENADSVGKKQTLQEQFKIVKQKTSKSHVMQYGTLSFTSDPIGDFMGDTTLNGSLTATNPRKPSVNVNSRDIPLHLAYYEYIRADKSDFVGRQKLAAALITEVQERQKADMIFHALSKNVAAEEKFFQSANLESDCLSCCDEVHQALENSCGGYTDYSLQYARVIHNLCEVSDAATIIKELEALC